MREFIHGRPMLALTPAMIQAGEAAFMDEAGEYYSQKLPDPGPIYAAVFAAMVAVAPAKLMEQYAARQRL